MNEGCQMTENKLGTKDFKNFSTLFLKSTTSNQHLSNVKIIENLILGFEEIVHSHDLNKEGYPQNTGPVIHTSEMLVLENPFPVEMHIDTSEMISIYQKRHLY